MAEDDLINLRHDVDRHEEAVTQDAKDIADLKEQVKLLKEYLVKSVVLSRTLYAYFATDKMQPAGERARGEIKKLLDGLHDGLGIQRP